MSLPTLSTAALQGSAVSTPPNASTSPVRTFSLPFRATHERVSLRGAEMRDLPAVIAHLSRSRELSFCPRWEAEKIREMLGHRAPIVIAEDQGQIVGIGTAGIHGMRGIIHNLSVDTAHQNSGIDRAIVRELIGQLLDRGIRRIHTFVNNVDEDTRAFFGDFGFRPQDGERLLQRDLVSPFDKDLAPLAPPAGLTLRKATLADLSPLLKTLEPVPELAFQAWEETLLREQLLSPNGSIFLVATNSSGDYVGALIGGHHGLRGTINHLWAAENVRRCGIGRLLLNHSLHDFEKANVKRLHIMLTSGNEKGYAFWSKVHFQEIPGETFLEVDV